MLRQILNALCLLQILIVNTHCQLFGPDPKWKNPDGSKADLSTKYKVGDTVEIAWDALNQSRSDLWLTNWDNTKSTFNVSLTKDVDISVAGSYTWAIDVDAAVVKASNEFCLRFYPAGSTYFVLQFQQNISPGFVLEGGTTKPSTTSDVSVMSAATSSSSITSGTSMSDPVLGVSASMSSPSSSSNADAHAATAITTATTGSNAGSSNLDHNSSPPPSGLAVGAIVGIVIGAVAGVVALLAIGCFLGRRYRVERRNQDHLGDGQHLRGHSGTSFSPAPPYSWMPAAIRDKSPYQLQEMSATTMPQPVEAGAGTPVRSKPGLHELRN